MIIAFVGQKGGSGKSTLSACVAAELVARKQKVLIVDADPQQSILTWHDAGQESGQKLPLVVAMTGSLHRENQLPALVSSFDHIIIDTPGRISEVQGSALMMADVAILPCGPSGYEVWSLGDSIKMIEMARTYRPDLKVAICINKTRASTTLSKGVKAVFAETGLHVFNTQIGFRQAFQDATTAGMGVTKFAPKDTASKEMKSLVNEILAFGEDRGGKRAKAEARHAVGA